MEKALKIESRERFGKKRKKKTNKKRKVKYPNKKVNQKDKISKTTEKTGLNINNYDLKEDQEVEEPEGISKEQITLGVKIPKQSIFDRLKKRVIILEEKIDSIPFWKNFVAVFSSVFGLLSTLALTIYIALNFSRIPNNIPLFYNTANGGWDLVDKSFFLSIPIMAIVANIIIFRFAVKIYNFDRNLVIMMGILQNIVNLLMILTVVQLLSLVSVIN